MKQNFMEEAFLEAEIAFKENEVPIGCVIVKDDKIIARAHNKKEQMKSSVAHAEILAIQIANEVLDSWYLDECSMYVTLEPCIMCAGAIQQSRMKEVYYATSEPKFGAYGSKINLDEIEGWNHYPVLYRDTSVKRSSDLLKEFFRRKRSEKKEL